MESFKSLHLLRKLFITVIIVGFLGFGQILVYQIFLPPITSDIAVKQVENSDEAFQELRATEVAKNSIATAFSIAYVFVLCFIWWKPVFVLMSDLKKSCC